MPYTPSTPPSNLTEGLLEPGSVGSALGGVYTSEVLLTDYDLTPQELTQLFERHNHSPSLRMMLKNMGFSRGVKAPTTGHYEADWKKDNFVVGSIVQASTGAGTDVIVELDPVSMYSVTINGNTVAGSYPIVGDVVYFRNRKAGRIVAKDTSVTPHRLTIRPLKSNVDLDGNTVFVGGRYFISTNMHAEGSRLPGGRLDRIIKYTNTFQIVKQALRATGSSLTDELYFEPIPGVKGAMWLRGVESSEFRFEEACDGALLFGQTADNLSETPPALEYSVPVKGTEGLIEWALTNGHEDTYLPGMYSVQDFDDVAAIFEAERIGTNEILVLQGFDICQELENVLFDYVKQTMFEVTQKQSEKYYVTIGFSAIQKSGYIFNFKKVDALNDTKGAGTAGYDFPGWQIFMPAGMVTEKATGVRVPTVGYEYKELNGYSREVVLTPLDGTGSTRPATLEDDIKVLGWTSEIAFHGTCPNQVVIQRPA